MKQLQSKRIAELYLHSEEFLAKLCKENCDPNLAKSLWKSYLDIFTADDIKFVSGKPIKKAPNFDYYRQLYIIQLLLLRHTVNDHKYKDLNPEIDKLTPTIICDNIIENTNNYHIIKLKSDISIDYILTLKKVINLLPSISNHYASLFTSIKILLINTFNRYAAHKKIQPFHCDFYEFETNGRFTFYKTFYTACPSLLVNLLPHNPIKLTSEIIKEEIISLTAKEVFFKDSAKQNSFNIEKILDSYFMGLSIAEHHLSQSEFLPCIKKLTQILEDSKAITKISLLIDKKTQKFYILLHILQLVIRARLGQCIQRNALHTLENKDIHESILYYKKIANQSGEELKKFEEFSKKINSYSKKNDPLPLTQINSLLQTYQQLLSDSQVIAQFSIHDNYQHLHKIATKVKSITTTAVCEPLIINTTSESAHINSQKTIIVDSKKHNIVSPTITPVPETKILKQDTTSIQSQQDKKKLKNKKHKDKQKKKSRQAKKTTGFPKRARRNSAISNEPAATTNTIATTAPAIAASTTPKASITLSQTTLPKTSTPTAIIKENSSVKKPARVVSTKKIPLATTVKPTLSPRDKKVNTLKPVVKSPPIVKPINSAWVKPPVIMGVKPTKKFSTKTQLKSTSTPLAEIPSQKIPQIKSPEKQSLKKKQQIDSHTDIHKMENDTSSSDSSSLSSFDPLLSSSHSTTSRSDISTTTSTSSFIPALDNHSDITPISTIDSKTSSSLSKQGIWLPLDQTIHTMNLPTAVKELYTFLTTQIMLVREENKLVTSSEVASTCPPVMFKGGCIRHSFESFVLQVFTTPINQKTATVLLTTNKILKKLIILYKEKEQWWGWAYNSNKQLVRLHIDPKLLPASIIYLPDELYTTVLQNLTNTLGFIYEPTPNDYDLTIESSKDPKEQIAISNLMKELKAKQSKKIPTLYRLTLQGESKEQYSIDINIVLPGEFTSDFKINSLQAYYDEDKDSVHILYNSAYFLSADDVQKHIASGLLTTVNPAEKYFGSTPTDAIRILRGIRFSCNGHWSFGKTEIAAIAEHAHLLRTEELQGQIVVELGKLKPLQQLIALTSYSNLQLIEHLFYKPQGTTTHNIQFEELQSWIQAGVSLQHLYQLYRAGFWLQPNEEFKLNQIIIHNHLQARKKPQHLLCAFRISQRYNMAFFNFEFIQKYFKDSFNNDLLRHNFDAIHEEFCHLYLNNNCVQNFLAMYHNGIFSLVFPGAFKQLSAVDEYHKLITALSTTDQTYARSRSIKYVYKNFLALELIDLIKTKKLDLKLFTTPKLLFHTLKSKHLFLENPQEQKPWVYLSLWEGMDEIMQAAICGMVEGAFLPTFHRLHQTLVLSSAAPYPMPLQQPFPFHNQPEEQKHPQKIAKPLPRNNSRKHNHRTPKLFQPPSPPNMLPPLPRTPEKSAILPYQPGKPTQ